MMHLHGFSISAPGKAGAGWLCLHLTLFAAHADQVRMDAPPGSGLYGYDMAALPNGNIVVTDPGYDAPGPVSNVGAAYLYDGRTLELISVLTGARAGDSVGVSVTVLKNGNYLISSPGWANGGKAEAGALTWGSAVTGVSGKVSPDNSLVGTAAGDRAGSGLIYPLSNGNAVVCSPEAGNGDGIKTGAVTWINGGTGTAGPVSAANSLVGSTAYDGIGGWNSVTVLPTDDYVVITPLWDSGTAENAGAVTLGKGHTGVRGLISPSNSLTGSSRDDGVGDGGVTSLGNGNFLVSSPHWSNGAAAAAGAVTWCGGLTGTAGSVTPSNSLVGTRSNDRIGLPWATDRGGGITVLANGNYLVLAPSWDNGPVTGAGAVVWGDGKTGTSGAVSADNALTGSSQYDHVGVGACALANGNYVVISPGWSNGDETSAGAVTWCDGAAGRRGVVTARNSLVGLKEDMVGGSGQIWQQSSGVVALSNGNYVVLSPLWNGRRGRETFGAVTWGDGSAGVSGLVSPENSLVGSVGGDSVGSQGVTALANGNYVVCSPDWSGSPEYNRTGRGAVTWGSGVTGVAGRVSAENSLVGRRMGDHVGWGRVTALSNGHYVVGSPGYQNQGIPESGAATWGNGFSGTAGEVSESNSLVGGHYRDEIGDIVRIKALKNGNYLVISPRCTNGTAEGAGAVTWGDGSKGVAGTVSPSNSLMGDNNEDSLGHGYNWGDGGVMELENGNYVVNSPVWGGDGPSVSGALTCGSGTGGLTGVVSAGNSLLGTTTGASFRKEVVLLENGERTFIARNSDWHEGNGMAALLSAEAAGGAPHHIPEIVRNTVPGLDSYMRVVADPRHSRMLVSQRPINRLTVVFLGNPAFQSWSRENFGGGTAKTGLQDDFDGDGVGNLLEFAFGTDPADPASGHEGLKYEGPWAGGGALQSPGGPVIGHRETPEGRELRILFARRRDHLMAGLSYQPQFSSDLVSWEASKGVPVVLASDGAHQVMSLAWPGGNGGGTPRFFRVKVESAASARN